VAICYSPLELLGIKAIALTDETLAQTPQVFQSIEIGNYSLVYISPERTLAKDGPFWQLGAYQAKDWRVRKWVRVDGDMMYIVVCSNDITGWGRF
jgi:superfamily II DNA helicase RecQ